MENILDELFIEELQDLLALPKLKMKKEKKDAKDKFKRRSTLDETINVLLKGKE